MGLVTILFVGIMENEEVIHVEIGGTYRIDGEVIRRYLPPCENNKKFLHLGNLEKWFTEYIDSEVYKTMEHYLALKRRILEIHVYINRGNVDSVIKERRLVPSWFERIKSSVRIDVKTRGVVLESEKDIKKERYHLDETHSAIHRKLIDIFIERKVLLQMHVYIKHKYIKEHKRPGFYPCPFDIKLETAEFWHNEAIESQVEALKKTIILSQEKLNKEA